LQRGSFALKEIAYGPFSKTVYLPVAIQFESAAAEFVDGVLAIELPVSSTQYIPTARTEIRMVVKRTLA
jgi:HSP20 family molecular chaperone IbpA